MNFDKTNNNFNDREAKVFELLRKNYELDEIARIMHISLHTVKSHINKIKRMNIN